ncbi:response regulator [Klebsiella quasipneumoniae subsp. similipneumoniae]|uniref:response regulator n=1 Tax=Klebsiella pneumoniae complex TaxID=3390273 RepID=UPI00124ABDDD|nr:MULTISPECIES: response regulator [Klebsiella]EIW5947167.1 response regulator [Klebsiella pneumoniae]KAA6132105.1 response regulator [Klebsiella pneumoniae subsp. pneumoniae]MBD7787434.1 response regulator [Klebsiella pneumoniae]MBG2001986.1 response regulator [Klebsiella pneumoniae]MBG2067078.1 response regulator [Klebsiella pneumoniae]
MTKLILLVEDEYPKFIQIYNYINSLNLGQEFSILKARSVNSALDCIDDNRPDLILLDMSLPTIDIDVPNGEAGGRAQGFGGIEVLRYMLYSDISCLTIVVTGYEAFPREDGDVDLSELEIELKEEFPNIVHSILHYNSTNEFWKLKLKEAMVSIWQEGH